MPSYVVKPDPDEDFYVYWSSVVDNWVLAGPRQVFIDDGIDPDRIDRADKHGSSARWWMPVPYGWEDEWFILREDPRINYDRGDGCWVLPRKNLRAYVDRPESDIIDDLVEWMDDDS